MSNSPQNKNKPKPTPCRHYTLHFADGGYFVECNNCGYRWVATERDCYGAVVDPRAREMGLSEADTRSDPFGRKDVL